MTDSANPADDGRIAENIMHFVRTLRAAGLPVGPGKVLRAISAVEAVGIRRRDDFYWALHAVLVNRRDQQELFDQAFHVFWRNPKILERMLGLFLPSFGGSDEDARELSSGVRMLGSSRPSMRSRILGLRQNTWNAWSNSSCWSRRLTRTACSAQ